MALPVGKLVSAHNPGKSFTGFLSAVKDSHSTNQQKAFRGRGIVKDTYGSEWQVAKTTAAMGEHRGIHGGYLLPIDYTLALIDTLAEESFIWPRATVIPMTTQMMEAPKVDVETVTNTVGVPTWFGGASFTWGFQQAPTEVSEPRFRQIQLNAWDLLGRAVMSNDFLADTGPEGEQALVKMFGQAAAWFTEFAFLQGLGAAGSMPLGIIPSPGSKTQNRAGASHINNVDIAKMAGLLLPQSWRTAIWAVSPSALADVTNPAQVSGFVQNQYAAESCDGLVGFLLGRPVFVTDKLPVLGTKGDFILFDPRMYVIGNRQQVLVDVSEHDLFQSNQTSMRIWVRCDGKPIVSAPITLADNATAVSPYVVLN